MILSFAEFVWGSVRDHPVTALLAFVVIVLVGVIFGVFYTFDSKLNALKKVIPGPPQLPLFGNTFELLGGPEAILKKFEQWTEEYGSRILYKIGSYWIVSVSGAKDLEKVLTSTAETHKSVDYDQMIPWLGEGLLTSNGKKWSHRRKLLTPAFHFKILEEFIEVFNEQSKVLVQSIDEQVSHTDNLIIDIFPYLVRCTLDIICETAMGVKIGAQKNKNTKYSSAIERVKELQLYRGLRPWLEPAWIWNTFSYGAEEKRVIKELHEFTNKVIQERKEKLMKQKIEVDEQQNSSNEKKRRLALMDLMLEAQLSNGSFSDDGIREETDTFMFAGHDTTSTAASFCIFHLGNHPEIQARLHSELDDVLGEDITRNVTSEDLSKLKYLECCIKESMRLTAPVPIVARNIQHGLELEKGVVLPKETLLMIFPFQLHRDPNVFPDPLKFKPERFYPENVQDRHPFAFLPFSAGPRNCIGQKFAMMELKILLANIFRNFKVKSHETLEDLKLTANIILHSKNGLNVTFQRRF